MVANFLINQSKIPVIKECKIYNFADYKKVRTVEITCPVCGRKKKLQIDITKPETVHYCSHFCASKAAFKSLANLSDKREVENFIKSKEDIIDKTVCRMINDVTRDKNLSPADMRQEARVNLFYLYNRCKRGKRDPYAHSDAYIFEHIKTAMRLTSTEKKKFYNSIEETREDNDEWVNNKFKSSYDIDKQIDIKNILDKIFKLANEDQNVFMAVLHALLYEKEKDEVNGKIFKDICRKKFNLSDGSNIWKYVKKGTEYIYYNDRENIKQYVDIHRLKNLYRFNDSTITEEEFGKELEDLLNYYAGYRVCSICGKKFKPTNQGVLGTKNAICSPECRKKAHNLRCEAYRKRQGQTTGKVFRKCTICGKEFEAKGIAKSAKNAYCSEDCRNKSTKIYKQQLKEKLCH